MSFRFKGIIGLLFMCCGSLQAQVQAEEDSIAICSLHEVVVTGTRTERTINSLPIPAQSIEGKNIQKLGLSRLSEVIQEQTGLITVSAFGGGQGVQMQGLDSAYTLILIDGEPLVGRSAGTLDLSRISINNIERIEVIKGASSSLYGSEALAGVINIITKKHQKDQKIHLNANYKYGTFNTHDLSTSIRYGKNKVAYDFFVNGFKSDGYNLSSNDFLPTVLPYENFTINPKVNYQLNSKISIAVSSRFFNQNQENRSTISNENFLGESNCKESNNSILVNHHASDRLKLVYDLYATNYYTNQYLLDSQNQTFENDFYNQWFYRPEIRAHYKIKKEKKHTLTSGIGLNHETLNRTDFSQTGNLNSEYIFSQLEWFVKTKLNFLLGFRYDHHEQYRSQFSPKIGLNYAITEALSVKSSLGYGYKAPDFRQLYFDFTNSSVGYTVLGHNVALEKLEEFTKNGQILSKNNVDFSTALKPESSKNANLGISYNYKKIKASGNVFYNSIDNLIDTRPIAQKTNGQNIFTYFNINQIFTYGLESNFSYQITQDININCGYQYLIAKDKSVVKQINKGEVFARDTQTLSTFMLNKQDYFGLYNRSKHTANFKINYTIPQINTDISLRFIYRSKYGNFDTNNNGILDNYDQFIKGYVLTNLNLTYTYQNKYTLQLGSNNLFNFKDVNNVPTIPGRQSYVRLTYQIN